MNKINLGVFSELANNKADRDLRNVDLNKTDIIIEYQEPTAENDYTWYRLYASGWVEQGGRSTGSSEGLKTISLPIEMADKHYYFIATPSLPTDDANQAPVFGIRRQENSNLDTTSAVAIIMTFSIYNNSTGTGASGYSSHQFVWQVSGKANMTGHEIIPSKAEQDEGEHRVIEFQKPTAENNYTWYRKYADGWIEQGGIGTAATATFVVDMPITMSNTNYTAIFQTEAGRMINVEYKYVSSIQAWISDNHTGKYNWEVKGMYATEE